MEYFVNKSPDAFRTISEVAEELDLPQHVLRFWETRFNQIKPMKRGGGRRYYRPEDVELLSNIKSLLYREGYTIRGVQRLLKEQGAKHLDPTAAKQNAVAAVTADSDPAIEEESAAGAVSKSAVEVAEFSKANGQKKNKSLLGKLSGMVTGEDDATDGEVSASDMQALKGTLQELLECKRLLDQTRQS